MSTTWEKTEINEWRSEQPVRKRKWLKWSIEELWRRKVDTALKRRMSPTFMGCLKKRELLLHLVKECLVLSNTSGPKSWSKNKSFSSYFWRNGRCSGLMTTNWGLGLFNGFRSMSDHQPFQFTRVQSGGFLLPYVDAAAQSNDEPMGYQSSFSGICLKMPQMSLWIVSLHRLLRIWGTVVMVVCQIANNLGITRMKCSLQNTRATLK